MFYIKFLYPIQCKLNIQILFLVFKTELLLYRTTKNWSDKNLFYLCYFCEKRSYLLTTYKQNIHCSSKKCRPEQCDWVILLEIVRKLEFRSISPIKFLISDISMIFTLAELRCINLKEVATSVITQASIWNYTWNDSCDVYISKSHFSHDERSNVTRLVESLGITGIDKKEKQTELIDSCLLMSLSIDKLKILNSLPNSYPTTRKIRPIEKIIN